VRAQTRTPISHHSEKVEEREPQKQVVRGLAAKGSKLFAVRLGVHELLDVARTIYQDTRKDIIESKSQLTRPLTLVAESISGQ